MLKNLIILVALLGAGFIFRSCASQSEDMVYARRRSTGGYYFIYSGRVWVHKSFREGSRGGGYRGGGPGVGK